MNYYSQQITSINKKVVYYRSALINMQEMVESFKEIIVKLSDTKKFQLKSINALSSAVDDLIRETLKMIVNTESSISELLSKKNYYISKNAEELNKLNKEEIK